VPWVGGGRHPLALPFDPTVMVHSPKSVTQQVSQFEVG
jgi:hypothetical protein